MSLVVNDHFPVGKQKFPWHAYTVFVRFPSHLSKQVFREKQMEVKANSDRLFGSSALKQLAQPSPTAVGLWAPTIQLSSLLTLVCLYSHCLPLLGQLSESVMLRSLLLFSPSKTLSIDCSSTKTIL